MQILQDKSEVDDLIAFKGDDIFFFQYSTAIEHDEYVKLVNTMANLVTEVSKHAPKMKFKGYDLNKNGPHPLFEKKHPNVWLSAGN